MPRLDVIRDGDGCWPDLLESRHAVIHLGNDAPPIQMALLKAGMDSGKASVTMRIDLPGGQVVLAETSLKLLKQAVEALVIWDNS